MRGRGRDGFLVGRPRLSKWRWPSVLREYMLEAEKGSEEATEPWGEATGETAGFLVGGGAGETRRTGTGFSVMGSSCWVGAQRRSSPLAKRLKMEGIAAWVADADEVEVSMTLEAIARDWSSL